MLSKNYLILNIFQAEEIYEKAKEQGKTAVIAREDIRASDLMHLALGNLPPGKCKDIKQSKFG